MFDIGKRVITVKKDFDRKTYVFDSLFNQQSRQSDVFERVASPVVTSIIQGYNGTIFAYGQTGTGKTHTMIGDTSDQANWGIIPRCCQALYDHISSDPESSYTIQIGFLQLYMEMLQDLLYPDSNRPIRIREDPDEGVYLSGINWVGCSNVSQCMKLLAQGDRNRNTSFTKMNATSSRSHAVYMIKMEKRRKYTPEALEELSRQGSIPDSGLTKSTLYLTDLAGSERVKKSKAVGNRLDEAKNINLALLALGNCIHALSERKKTKYIPFRDSKLTRLLEDSLGGNCKTSLVITIGPAAYHTGETISTLQFGSRAMKIENRPEINKQIDYRALCAQLQAELDRVNDDKGHNYFDNSGLLAEIEQLRQ